MREREREEREREGGGGIERGKGADKDRETQRERERGWEEGGGGEEVGREEGKGGGKLAHMAWVTMTVKRMQQHRPEMKGVHQHVTRRREDVKDRDSPQTTASYSFPVRIDSISLFHCKNFHSAVYATFYFLS